MRKLTLKREKTFVGCAGKMKVYIEDSTGDFVFGDEIVCRKLGELKNGEEATYEIGEGAALLLVNADSLSADYCYDRYQIPEGGEDISLSGKNTFNPMLGNPFRFNGISEVERGDKKVNTKKSLILILCAIVVGLIFGYTVTTVAFGIIGMQEETFDIGKMEITLTRSFSPQAMYGYEAVFASSDVEIMVFRNAFSNAEGSDMTTEEYARVVLAAQKVKNAENSSDGTMTSFVFTRETDGNESYTYHLYVYKTDDAFWHIFFAVKEDKADKYADDIAKWAKSVVFE